MEEREIVDCSYLINYLTGECTEWERAAFERHLRACVTCREELKELSDVWEALPFEIEEVEVPADLKAEVMAATRPQAEPSHNEGRDWSQTGQIGSSKKRAYTWVFTSAAAIIIGFAAGIWWHSKPPVSEAISSTALNQPAEIVSTYQLKSVEDTMPTASGTVWVLQNGDTHNVVINLQGLKPTEGDWTYQVWYNRSGKRYNCGTLRVDGQGDGLLTYKIPVTSKELRIDSFGVTLEPDPNGSAPRGKKILGT
ncbi:anti-sigma factor [Paenibacillus ferrarius]|uniref:anti-sigma factor n=1 Tax=Paenibacillus ferrarius TaxID=1469647 RepID=UPI003D2E7609